MEEKIKQALKIIKEECAKCIIYKLLGDCIAVNTVPDMLEV